MEIKRKIYDKLVDWKVKYNGKYSLLIEGARRIGKSTVATKLGREKYKSFIVIDFAKAKKKIKDNFYDNLDDLDIFFQNISLEYNTPLYRRESLIIFDEIQKFPRAREALKYLVEDGRYDFIATGSLISIKENVDILIPSEEIKIKMYPVDFEEFLEFMGEGMLIQYIHSCFEACKPLENSFHNKAMRLFREYMLVGGMPQSVVAYKENDRSFFAADIAKRKILELYRDDIKKSSKKYNSKVSALFENIPGYLSSHEKKVVLSDLGDNQRFSQYDEPLFWLEDSMICNLCYKCTNPNIGLAFNKDDSYVKCYMGDTGLLVSLAFSENEIMTNELYKEIMFGKLSLNEGMLYENLISQILVAKGKKLYFYTSYNKDKGRNDIEIDFLLSNESKTNFKVYPLEIKSSKNFTNISFDRFKNKFKNKIEGGYIISPKQYKKEEGYTYLPPYMLICLFN